MAVPDYLSSSFYHARFNCTTVAEIITQIRYELCTVNDPVWTEPTTATFKSPVDSGGRFFSLAVAQVGTNTSQLSTIAYDQNGSTVYSGRVYIEASTLHTRVWINSGQNHFELNINRNTTSINECFHCGMVDPYPLSKAAVSTYVYAHASRNSGGALSGNSCVQMACTGDTTHDYKVIEYSYQGASGSPALVSLGCKPLYRPAYLRSGTIVMGRMYQTVYAQDTVLNIPGSIVEIPIDDTSTGKFIVTADPSIHFHTRLQRIE